MQELSLHSVVMGTVLHWKWRLDLDEACMALDDLYRNADTVVMIEYTLPLCQIIRLQRSISSFQRPLEATKLSRERQEYYVIIERSKKVLLDCVSFACLRELFELIGAPSPRRNPPTSFRTLKSA